MCGRFSQKSERDDITEEFYINSFSSEVNISYNVAPTQKAGIIIKNGIMSYDNYRWGLIPFWSKNITKFPLINAKAETITQKSSFKQAFQNKRCLVPINGFYEWKKDGSAKIPHYIFLKNEPLFSLAGIWDEWLDADNNKLRSFSIITTEANTKLQQLHERMPVIINKVDRSSWLDPGTSKEALLSLLIPYKEENVDYYIISSFVNSPKNNSDNCIKKV